MPEDPTIHPEIRVARFVPAEGGKSARGEVGR
jgi:hypothetical protein